MPTFSNMEFPAFSNIRDICTTYSLQSKILRDFKKIHFGWFWAYERKNFQSSGYLKNARGYFNHALRVLRNRNVIYMRSPIEIALLFKGNMHEVKNDNWNYCALIPENEKSGAKMFGIGEPLETMLFFQNNYTTKKFMLEIICTITKKNSGPSEENLLAYDETFKQSDSLYKVLSVCIYEVSYNTFTTWFNVVSSSSQKFAANSPTAS